MEQFIQLIEQSDDFFDGYMLIQTWENGGDGGRGGGGCIWSDGYGHGENGFPSGDGRGHGDGGHSDGNGGYY